MLAELDPGTAVVKPAFNPTFTGALTSKIKVVAVSPDGTRLIFGGRFGTVANNGVTLDTETAVVDISNPTAPRLTPHAWRSPYDRSLQQDMSVSPDGKWIGVAFRGTPLPGNNVFLISTVESTQTERWVHAMGNSVFGVGVSNNAVYVSGHFCRIAVGPGATDVMSPAMGISSCDGATVDGAWRGHLAALSLTDGTPLTWNPGADSSTGGREITITTRGVLAGYDGERTNSTRVGALAFYDFGPNAEDIVAPSDVTYTAPAAGATVTSPVRISGGATDNVAIGSYLVAVKVADGRFVQADGSLAAARYEFKPVVKADGSFDLDAVIPPGSYIAEARAVDTLGNVSVNSTTRSFTFPAADVTSPATTVVVPASVTPGSAVTATGSASDDLAVASIRARVTDSAGLYLQNDFTLAAVVNDLPITAVVPAMVVGWSVSLGSTLPVGSYTVEIQVADSSGNTATKTATLAVTAVAASTAGIIGYNGFTPKTGNYTMGATFTVDTPSSVTAIGIFDTNGNGTFDNAADTPAGLWRQSDKALLGQVTVAKTTSSEGGWFYGNLATPVALTPGTVYVIGLAGAFRSSDGGASWARLPDKISSIAFDVQRSGVVYAGGYQQLRISENSGVDWTPLPGPGLFQPEGVIVDPSRPGTIYVRSGDRYHRSSDRGQTWKLLSISTFNLTASADVPVLYAHAAPYGTNSLMQSRDGGDTWTSVARNLFRSEAAQLIEFRGAVFAT